MMHHGTVTLSRKVGRTLPRSSEQQTQSPAHDCKISRALPQGGKAWFAPGVAVGWQGSAAAVHGGEVTI